MSHLQSQKFLQKKTSKNNFYSRQKLAITKTTY